MDRIIIKPKFTRQDIEKMVAPALEQIRRAIRENLQSIGLTFVTLARNSGSYHNWTGNLRNSVGYIILEDGVVIEEDFVETVPPKPPKPGAKKIEGPVGVEKGRLVAEEIGKDHPQGFVLIGVAGMEYAAAVEATGREVITASTETALDLMRQAFERLQSNINSR